MLPIHNKKIRNSQMRHVFFTTKTLSPTKRPTIWQQKIKHPRKFQLFETFLWGISLWERAPCYGGYKGISVLVIPANILQSDTWSSQPPKLGLCGL